MWAGSFEPRDSQANLFVVSHNELSHWFQAEGDNGSSWRDQSLDLNSMIQPLRVSALKFEVEVEVKACLALQDFRR